MMQRRLIALRVHEGCYSSLFVYYADYFTTLVQNVRLRHVMHALNRTHHWSMDASIVRCSMLCQTFIFINERHAVPQLGLDRVRLQSVRALTLLFNQM